MATTSDVSNPLKGLSDVVKAKGLPPVHLWNPPFCGDIDMRIAADGLWYYMNSPIGRMPLVKLFSSILRYDADGKFYLITPVEKCGIRVDDAPFVAIRMQVAGKGHDQVISFETNVDDEIVVGSEHPLRVAEEAGTGGLSLMFWCGAIWKLWFRAHCFMISRRWVWLKVSGLGFGHQVGFTRCRRPLRSRQVGE